MLTTGLAAVSILALTYGTPNFDLADIDGSGDALEAVTIRTRDESDTLLETTIITGETPGAGNRKVVNVSFPSVTPIKLVFVQGRAEGNPAGPAVPSTTSTPTAPL